MRRVCSAAGASPHHGRGAGRQSGTFLCCWTPQSPLTVCVHASVRMERAGWRLKKNKVPPHCIFTLVTPKPGRWGAAQPCSAGAQPLGGKVTLSLPLRGPLCVSAAHCLQVPFCVLDQWSPINYSSSVCVTIINKCDYEVQMCWMWNLISMAAFSFLTWCYELIIKAL